MEEEYYHLDYPSLALSYYLNQGFYAHHAAGSAHSLGLIPEHVERGRLLSDWLWELQKKWEKSSKTKDFVERNPKLEAMYLFVLQAELTHYQQGLISQHKFSCEQPAAKRYAKARKQFLEPENGIPAYKRMRNRGEAKRLYRWSVDNAQARSMKYVLQHYCGIKVEGQEDLSEYKSWARIDNITIEQAAERGARNNFQSEIKILEEQFNEQ